MCYSSGIIKRAHTAHYRLSYYKTRAGDMVTSAKVYIYKPKQNGN